MGLMVLSHEKMGYKFHWTTSLNIFILQNLQAVLAFKKLNFFISLVQLMINLTDQIIAKSVKI